MTLLETLRPVFQTSTLEVVASNRTALICMSLSNH